MIFELQPDKFHLVEPLIKMDFHLLPPAIINHRISGRIWVDNPKKPKSALTWDEHYSFSLLGDESNLSFNSSLEALFDEVIMPDALRREFREGWLECPERWGRKIQKNEILPGRLPMQYDREYYAIHQSTGLHWAEKMPAELSLEQIDEKFLKRTDLENFSGLLDMINLRWNTPDNFLGFGFGFCLLKGNSIVSYCLSLANCEDRCDIEIETMEGHRRQGYGSLVAAAFVDHALEEGYTEIGWDTFRTNSPSVQMALKLGFEKELDHRCFSGWYNPLDNLLVQAGWNLGQAKNYEEAASLYEKALTAIEDGESEVQRSYLLNIGIRGRFYFYAAKACAGSEEKKAALAKLQDAITNGFRDKDLLLEDEDLEVLRAEKGWEKLLERLE